MAAGTHSPDAATSPFSQRLLNAKSIGYMGGLALIFNQMTGPGIPFTSANFQDPGWVFTATMYFLFTIVSGFSMLYLVEAIQCIPGNTHFQGEVEYGTAINFYFGKRMHILMQTILYCALQSSAMQCIVLTAQATDNLLITTLGKTCGLSFAKGWICVSVQDPSLSSPFGSMWMVCTFGLLVVIAFSIPLGIADLEGNILFNIFMMFLSLVLGGTWIASSFITGIKPSRVPMAQPIALKYGQVVGTVLLNLGGSLIVPSWINLKHKNVNVQGLIWAATIGSAAYYVIIGVICGMGFDLDITGDLLHAMLKSGEPRIIAEISIGVFAYVMLLPGIPISFLVSRNNLIQNQVASPRFANFLAFVLPWILLVPFQTGPYMFQFQTWTSLVFCSSANFVIPFIVYFQCVKFRSEYNVKRTLTQNQIWLLKSIHKESIRINAFMDEKSHQLLREPSKGKDVVMKPSDHIKFSSEMTKSSSMPHSKHVSSTMTTDPVSSNMHSHQLSPSHLSRDTSTHESNPAPAFSVTGDVSHVVTLEPKKSYPTVSKLEDLQHTSTQPAEVPDASTMATQSSRDARFVLRREFVTANESFMSAEDTGIPLEVLEMDIPEPDVLHNIRSSRISHSVAHGRVSHTDSSSNMSPPQQSVAGIFDVVDQQPSEHQSVQQDASTVNLHAPGSFPRSLEPDLQMQSMRSAHSSAHSLDTHPEPSDAANHPRTSLSTTSRRNSIQNTIAHDKQRRMSFKSSIDSNLHLVRSSTLESLPCEPDYHGAPFRILPSWLPIPVYPFAVVLSIATIAICIGNIVFNAYLEAINYI